MKRSWVVRWLTRAEVPLVALLVVILIVGAVTTPAFLSWNNILATAASMMPTMLVALGVTAALYGGLPDLSVGSVLGLGAIAFALVLQATGSEGLAVAAALGAGVLVGILNGIVVVGFGADPLITTIGTLGLVRGLVFVLNGNRSVAVSAPVLADVVAAKLGPVPIVFLIIVAGFVGLTVVVRKLRLGRHMQAVGAGGDSARRRGVPVSRIRFGLLLFSALMAASAAVIAAAQLQAALVLLGTGLELQVYAAVLITGFSLTRGGSGSPLLTVVGLVVLALLSSLLALSNVPAAWVNIVTGLLLVAAIGLDVWRRGGRGVTIRE